MLKEKVMIVNLHMTQWSASKYDAEASKEIEEAHNAKDAARVTKKLIENSAEFNAIRNNQNAARKFHNSLTLPWEDKGPRILPVEKYFDYIKKMEEFKDENNLLVSQYLQGGYEKDKEEAKRKRLGSLYKKNDFPSTEELIRKFSFSYSVAPLADSADLRVKLTDDEVEEIKEKIENGITEKMKQANKEIAKRILTVVLKVFEKLNEKDVTFRDSLINNVENVREFVPTLNITNDEEIKKFNKKLKKICIKPARIRENRKVQKQVRKDAKKLLKQLKEYINE